MIKMNNNNRKRTLPQNRYFDNNNQKGKLQSLYNKFTTLGKDSLAKSDKVEAEGYFQMAEHYFRLLSCLPVQQEPKREQKQQDFYEDDSYPYSPSNATSQDCADCADSPTENDVDYNMNFDNENNSDSSTGNENTTDRERSPRRRPTKGLRSMRLPSFEKRQNRNSDGESNY